MAAAWFNRGKALMVNGGADWDTTDIRALLVTSSYSFDATDNFVSDVSSAELTDASYARETVTRSVVENDTDDQAEMTVDPITWAALDGALRPNAVIFFKYNASDAAAELLSYHDFAEVVPNGGDVTISFSGDNATLVQ